MQDRVIELEIKMAHFEQTIDELRKELKDAVEKEDYEKAAELRDQLNDLENDAKALA